MNVAPEVSVVVPTALRRPALLARALDSAREQEGVAAEIIVVMDAPPSTPAPDLGSDVNVIRTGRPVGASEARNQGVSAAKGTWVAFLDDDDAWRPGKLARQIEVAMQGGLSTIVATRFRMILNGRSYRVMPPQSYPPDAELSEWIFCMPTPFSSRGLLQTSTILASRDLLRRCGFAVRPSGQDVDWVLRATRRHGARLVQLDEALTDYYMEDSRDRVSRSGSWRDVASYVEENPDLFTRNGAAGALLTAATRKADSRGAYASIVRRAFQVGRPRAADLVASAAFAFVPPSPRRLVARAADVMIGKAH